MTRNQTLPDFRQPPRGRPSPKFTVDFTGGAQLLSRPDAFVRVRRLPDGTTVYTARRGPSPFTELSLRWSAFKTALSGSLLPIAVRMAAHAEELTAHINAMMRGPVQRVIDQANAAPRIAGLEARYYMRAALDPDYTFPAALTGLLQQILRGDTDYEPDLAYVTRENRIQIAVRAMVGWEQRGTWWAPRDLGAPPLIAHRVWGDTLVEVRCG